MNRADLKEKWLMTVVSVIWWLRGKRLLTKQWYGPEYELSKIEYATNRKFELEMARLRASNACLAIYMDTAEDVAKEQGDCFFSAWLVGKRVNDLVTMNDGYPDWFKSHVQEKSH